MTETVATSLLVEAARECVGTPWHHQARTPGAGIDCIGVLVYSARRARIRVDDVTDYPSTPQTGWLIAEISKQMVPVSLAELRLGDVLVFAWSTQPWHVALVSKVEPLSIIHAWRQVRVCVEQTLSESWRARIHSAWRFPAEAHR
jgi:cell wall-associated NlpC family hydrolase